VNILAMLYNTKYASVIDNAKKHVEQWTKDRSLKIDG